MTELTQIEREAKQVRDFIAELKGLTPKFNAAKERAEEELKLHLAKIDGERARLKELQDAASLIVQRLGIEDSPEPVETIRTEAEVSAVMAEDAEAVVAMADSPQDEAEAADTFESIGQIAAEVTAAVAAIAGDLPATDDQSEAPEMTDEQVERKELELAEAAPRSVSRFSPFAANPFA